MDQPADPDATPLSHRRAGFLAAGALVLQATAAVVAWWHITNRTPGTTSTLYASVGLWGDPAGMAVPAWRITTAVLVLAVLPILFVRVAAASWRHEPRPWRRDLALCAGLQLAALVSCFLWPASEPGHFWGGRTYLLNSTAQTFTLEGAPSLGWYLVGCALAAVLAARWMSRPMPDEP